MGAQDSDLGPRLLGPNHPSQKSPWTKAGGESERPGLTCPAPRLGFPMLQDLPSSLTAKRINTNTGFIFFHFNWKIISIL